MKKKRRAASPALGCLFWTALALVLVAVALAVREPVLRNLRTVFGRDETQTAEEPTPPPAPGPSSGTVSPAPAAAPDAAPAEPSPSPGAAAPGPAPSSTTAGEVAPAAASRPERTRTARIWFVKVDEGGTIELAPVTRSLPAGDSPLRDNLTALLAGPTASERGAGVLSLVPEGTVVRSVTVKGDIATIDFNEQFRFNALGLEGLRAQLRQVVWAATEFPTVSRVQVLIEGRRVDYLAPEGAAVGSPLGRDSDFQ